jgi:hypothetical protein
LPRKPDIGRTGIWPATPNNYPAADLRTAATTIDDLGYGTLPLGVNDRLSSVT